MSTKEVKKEAQIGKMNHKVEKTRSQGEKISVQDILKKYPNEPKEKEQMIENLIDPKIFKRSEDVNEAVGVNFFDDRTVITTKQTIELLRNFIRTSITDFHKVIAHYKNLYLKYKKRAENLKSDNTVLNASLNSKDHTIKHLKEELKNSKMLLISKEQELEELNIRLTMEKEKNYNFHTNEKQQSDYELQFRKQRKQINNLIKLMSQGIDIIDRSKHLTKYNSFKRSEESGVAYKLMVAYYLEYIPLVLQNENARNHLIDNSDLKNYLIENKVSSRTLKLNPNTRKYELTSVGYELVKQAKVRALINYLFKNQGFNELSENILTQKVIHILKKEYRRLFESGIKRGRPLDDQSLLISIRRSLVNRVLEGKMEVDIFEKPTVTLDELNSYIEQCERLLSLITKK